MTIVGTQAGLAQKLAAGLVGELAGRGVIAVNDNVAIGIIQAAKAANLVAGQEYLMIGFDDIPESRVVGLTTMHPPLDAMGTEAGRMVIDQLRERHDRTQVRLRSYLIPRTSTQGTLISRRNFASCP